ncbi:hypothetical protein FGM00_16910 [Aggregatimonas sangjinii]|uniref:Fibronectin type-III domain-containing protein n=1 Tax=Aggregatimonas sangjinii TaxID=2583587 RepID=A0A5B7SY75_9FLAO|nr:hypothetical protein [Aggregatimonas sangjinii]QCX01710.1 hypothetical protein FGM00_16910 [Aggregatimonas sangjinii]
MLKNPKVCLTAWYLVLIAGIGCTENESPIISDDGEDMTPTSNTAPAAFDLIEVPNDGVVFNINEVTFSWEAASDPDGDSVSYDVYIGTEPTDVSLLFGRVTSPEYEFSGRFKINKTYFWKVIAKDGKGGETESTSTFSFITRNINIPDEPISAEASFPIRFKHTTTVYDDRMWVVGGATRNGVTNSLIPYNDVWYSTDGIAWEEATENAAFSARSGHVALNYEDKLWVIGGNDGDLINDVWQSTDGWNWTQVTANADFPPMAGHKAIIFNDKMWIFYGSEVWTSTDGATWTKVNLKVPFPERTNYSVSIMDEKLWIVCGYIDVDSYKSDVWYSEDGEAWIENGREPWLSPRFDTGIVAFDDTLYIFGGRTGQFLQLSDELWTLTSRFDDIWHSNLTHNSTFGPRIWPTYTVYNDKIYMIAGAKSDFDGLGMNDVWVFD